MRKGTSRQEEDLGPLIAERRYRLGRKQIIARIGTPRPEPTPPGKHLAARTWVCPVQVVGLGDDRVVLVKGSDAFDALELSFQMIRMKIAPQAERLSLFGVKGFIGIRRFFPDLGVPGYTKAMEQVIEGAGRMFIAAYEHMAHQRGSRRRRASAR